MASQNIAICRAGVEELVRQFQRKGMKRTVGAIDGFHVGIQAPSFEEFAYVNKSDIHSINNQVALVEKHIMLLREMAPYYRLHIH